MTKTASLPVEITGLPGTLDAYPVYRIQVRDGIERSHQLLRLEVRAASKSSTLDWRHTLESLDARTREWVLKNSPGRATRINKRFGPQTLELLYRLCAAGIVVFDVEPPPGPNASHGALISWRLAASVDDYARQLAHKKELRRNELSDQARDVAAKLADHPHAQLLVEILTTPHDHSYLEHAVRAARAIVAEDPVTSDQESKDPRATSARFALLRLARGSLKDYAVDKEIIGRGGQAVVSVATHKATRVRLAFKRVRIRDEDAIARMRREIEAGRLFGKHPNVMPVIDADSESQWFVMPLAAGTAETYVDQLRAPDQLRELITAVCEALRAPHELGWVHRDLKPENLLFLDNRWTVADWGLGRRPRGETSLPDRTRSGTGYGTEGFAAPELSLDAHQAGPPADIYSLGQIIGTIVTGRRPQANIPLLPAHGPWREVVELSTRPDPADRFQSVDDLLDLIKSLR